MTYPVGRQLELTRERHATAPAKPANFLHEKQCLEAAPRKGRRPRYVLMPLAGGRWASWVRRPAFGTSAMPDQSPGRDETVDLPSLPMDAAIWQSIADELALAPQQIRIVELILRGRQDKEIAADLGLSFPTVRTYLGRIFERTGSPDRMGLVLRIFARAQELAGSSSHQD